MKLFTSVLFLLYAGCDTVNFGLTYQGQYGDYTVKRAIVGDTGTWDILIDAGGKQIIPLHR
jgi:hypothetical protein